MSKARSRCGRTSRLAAFAVAGVAVPLFIASSAQAQIKWNNGPREIARKIQPEQLEARLTELGQRDLEQRVLLHFARPVTSDEKAGLTASGVTVLDYVGENAYFARVDRDALNAGRLSRDNSILSVEAINHQWKMHPELADGVIQPWAIVGEHLVPRFDGEKVAPGERPQFEIETDVAVYINFHKDVDIDVEGANVIRGFGGEVRSLVRSNNMIVAHVPASRIEEIARTDSVLFIEPPLPLLSENNAENRVLTEVDQVQAAPYNLSGAGVDVLVYDGGQVRATHLAYTNAPIIGPSDTSGVSDHATHVAGTIGAGDTGAPGLDPTEIGMAPDVQIISYGFEQPGGLVQGFLYTDPGDLEADYTEAIALFGADISNNSIGTNTAPNGFPCDWEGNYNNTSILIDNIVRGSLGSPFRIVWANGNERQGGQACGGTYHTTAPPACAKNHIAVGSLDSDTDLNSSFTSWGPADDDRMKPDVSAPGCQVGGDGGVRSLSSSGDTSYGVKCGTSMASPTACGICALILEDWRTIFPSDPDPRNSTLKALLAHTAVDIEEAGPDYKTGYGSIRATNAIDQLRSGNLLEDSVDQGTSFLATVIVAPGEPELKITLAWDDAANVPLASPVLVNDLDLVVFSPSSARAFPWTLGGLANPSALAVQTQENHVDNLEQVFVQNPEAGAWFVEVRGTTVPQGPQPFSLVASPFLVNCGDAGTLVLNGNQFNCADTIGITVIDCGLNTSDSVLDTVNVSVDSTSETGEVLTLTETDPASAKFSGSIDTSTTDSPGVLLVADGDTITVTYNDADDGTGSPAIVTKNASVDCTPPAISNVVVADVQPRDATITFDTNEATSAIIHYGTSCGTLDSMEIELSLATSHTIMVTGLTDETDYFFSVEAFDSAGNGASDDNGGLCYTFTTPQVPDFFTEQFTGTEDLSGLAMFLAPSAGIDQYVACTFPIAGFPTDPAGGTSLPLTDDDSDLVTISGGNQVSLYGVSYPDLYVGSNGYVTLGATDTAYTETFTDHFDTPRIAAAFDDLNPSLGGTVSWKQEVDRMVVSYENISQFSNTDQNNFQIELFFDGTIQISWVAMITTDFIAGISEGAGLDPDFFPSDLSTYGSCGPRPPFANGASYSVPENTTFPITLGGADDGEPNPPGALTFTVTTLPNQPLRDAGTSLIIGAVPHVLAGGANQVIYEPGSGFAGADSFDFIVDDGGTPPDGGESAPATISLFVEPVITLPFVDDFFTTTFDPLKWATVTDAVIDSTGLSEPSEPNSARFNGHPNGGDTIETLLINANGYTNLILTYWFEETGGGETPDTGEDLVVEYLNNVGSWQEVARHLGSMAAMTNYAQDVINLPADAAHSGLRLRFSNTGTSGTTVFDDWFVDDIGLDGDPPASCDGDADGNGVVDVNDVAYVIFRLGNTGVPGSVDGDADGNGTVDINDIAYVIFRFGPC